ncbi:MAG: RHS domain-containing protein, partial [Enterobacter hormaechei]
MGCPEQLTNLTLRRAKAGLAALRLRPRQRHPLRAAMVTEFTRDRLPRCTAPGAREQLVSIASADAPSRSELSTDVTLPERRSWNACIATPRAASFPASVTPCGEVDCSCDAGRLLKHYEAQGKHGRAQFSYDARITSLPVTMRHWSRITACSLAGAVRYDHWAAWSAAATGCEQHYAYDAENRLVSARGTGPEGRFEARYHYDALGRRTRKIVTTTHGTTDTRFLWQGYRLLQEQQESGLCNTYINDPNEAWSPLARVDHLRDQNSGEIYWFNTDLNGAPLEVTDARGAVRWSGQYGSFGEVR